MKKPYLLLAAAWLLIAGPLLAQDPLREKLDLVFQPLDKSQVPTGFLADYATPLIPVDPFDGTLTEDNRTNMQTWRLLYGTLFSSYLYADNPLPALQEVNQRLAEARQSSEAIPVVMLNLDYNTLREDALEAGLLRVEDDQIYDVEDRQESPYLARRTFAASPAISYCESGYLSLVFSPELYFPISGPGVTSLRVDLDDGNGYQPVDWDTPVSTSYTSIGPKRVKVWLLTEDERLVESHFDIEVLNSACPTCNYAAGVAPVVFPAVAGVHSGGTVHIRRGGAHTQLISPLIVAEGYDASNVAPDLQRNYTIGDFLFDIRGDQTFPFNFRNALDNIGQYDIVFIDYNNGTDDIRRNAALFQEVVEWVNANKASTEANIVMGISMGGLVARYGLAQMVRQGRNPQTRLLITHDSPHRGANTPLGLQALTRQLLFNITPFFSTLDLSAELNQAYRLLDEPASQQMLILRATSFLGGIATNTFLDGEYRQMITFGGALQPAYRIIATSQGSQCGVGSLTPYSELVRSTGEAFLVTPSEVSFLINSQIRMDVVVNALPESGPSRRISYLRVYVRYQILRFITININLVNRDFSSPTNTLPWDGLPGGTQNVREQSGSRLPNFNRGFLSYFWAGINTVVAEDFCFVPTVSALDVADLNAQTVRGTYVGGVSRVSPARVANFIAQEQLGVNPTGQPLFNQPHTNFTARNSEWIYNEMRVITANPRNCSTECSPYAGLTIGGPGLVCGNTPYSVPAQTGAEYFWSVSGNASIVSGQSTPNLTLNPFGSSGTVTLSLTLIQNGCSFPLPARTVNISSDAPTFSNLRVSGQVPSASPPYFVCPGTYFLTVNVANATSPITWQLTSGTASLSPSSSGCSVTIGSNASIAISYSASNACGTSSGVFYMAGRCSGMITAHPNPADTYLEVHLSDNPDDSPVNASQEPAVPANGEYEIRLYNTYQQVGPSLITDGQKARIGTAHLPAGLYFLHVIGGRQVRKQQIIIEH